METTKLSTKGQIILPKAIRDAHAWNAGTEFIVEETARGVLLRPLRMLPETRLEDVVGCLKYTGKPKSIAEMKMAGPRAVLKRHARGRY